MAIKYLNWRTFLNLLLINSYQLKNGLFLKKVSLRRFITLLETSENF